ncbi:CinA family protein [Atopomonas sediminilitoris]|uniref:CinA family protein n=1 Tax=Atopomonas sediminilitoris TaxID=2919919 RepID=UPI001F4E6AEE|nr:CinA family protein [Atopomonas sediminilitoris]MCJ8168933.1 CinA family protein [Atopomonas sediminilitoris]
MVSEWDEITALAAQLGEVLVRNGQTVTTAESCTGGGVAEAITRIAGSSAWFQAGFVTYSNAQKTTMLDVPASLIDQYGAVSEPVVEAMAAGANKAVGADWAVAVSGVAGPGGGSANKPVGTVWMAWSGPQTSKTQCCHFMGDRHAIRQQAVKCALAQLIQLAQQENSSLG